MSNSADEPVDQERRDFLNVTAAGFGAVGAVCVAAPLVNQMNPDRSVLAMASTEVDLSGIAEGQTATVKWRGKPVFVRHRTAQEVAAAEQVNPAELRDPQADADRVKKKEWLIVQGVCTHLGCVPLTGEGDFKGWYCPCHGSHYDLSGRIRKGPAPKNLPVPDYQFVGDGKLVIG